MKQKKTIVILGIAIILGLAAFSGKLTDHFKPVSTKAEETGNPYSAINQLVRQNNANPSFSDSKEIAGLLIQHLSVLEIPEYLQTSVADQIATANLNGTSNITDAGIATAINNLADQSSAPAYAYTNTEQIKVVRSFLHSLMPDLVQVSGNMSDLEAFAVFVATLSQKVDNDAFMVTPAEFTASLNNPANLPFPGSSESVTPVVENGGESVKQAEMLGVVNSFVNSKNMLASNDIVSMIGIQ